MSLLRKFRCLLNSAMLGQALEEEPFLKMYPPADYYVEKAIQDLSSQEPGVQRLEELKQMPRQGCRSIINPQTVNAYAQRKGMFSLLLHVVLGTGSQFHNVFFNLNFYRSDPPPPPLC